MKKYKKPVLNVEQFTANEFIAACGDSGKTYKFTCNAPEGKLYYYPNSDGKIDGVHDQSDRSNRLGSFHPNTNVVHSAPTTDEFYDGFITSGWGGNRRTGVIVWIEYDRRGNVKDYHATKNLDITTWETSKS